MGFGKKKTQREDDPLAAFRRGHRAEDDVSSPDTVRSHEDDAAQLVGGHRHAGSGASPWLKSDASSDEYQVECKQTGNASLSVQWDWLEKITMEASGKGKTPAVHVRFLRTVPGVSSDWVMIPAAEFERLRKGE